MTTPPVSAGRGIPFHCPYCGDENLRPSEDGHGAWECHACLRAFSLKMLGMIPRGGSAPAAPRTTPSGSRAAVGEEVAR